MKLIQSFAAVLLLSSAGTAVASPVAECKSTIEARLTASTASRLQRTQDFQLRSVGWYVNDRADTYSMVIYYTDTATGRRGMTTATVLATNKECRLLSSNFFLFERR